ncbi:MAG: NADP-dependent succinic semialdehyde dehydrogenase [Frankiales bacterium]|nr:NADP-dependent succinic semialdehyde dehydrogenase [Frankiales bacterium]
MAIATTNPTTGQVVKTFDPLTDAELENRLARADAAFWSYRRTSFAERAGWMTAAADLLDVETDQIAELMVLEMGKTLTAAKAEVGKCAAGCRFYAEHAERLLAGYEADAAAVKAERAYVRWEPMGPVLAVMPWNFPLWQAFRFAAPALMAGNVGLLKHASNVPQTALLMEELFRRGGFPADVFQTLLIGSGQVEAVLRDRRVAAVTLTGSGPAGQSVAAIAGSEIKKSVLELGGSDPFVVMPSADLERAATVAATARCQNNGQSCIAAKRFIVHEQVADRFEELFADALRALVVGDPTVEGTDVGPLATEQGRADVEELVADAVDKGARVVLGGTRPDGPGWFYPPTLLTGITADMRMFAEEVFGPVAQLHRVPDLDAAIALANDTEFGLGSNAWTDDPAEQERFATELQAGMVFVNGMTASYPELPFGGIGTSGYGRELAELGIREFCSSKTVWVGQGGSASTRSE